MASYAPTDRVSWDSFRTKSLIVEYKKYDHLYNPQHELYRNKKTREETLGCIAKALNAAWYGMGITCSIDDIKKKLNGLRSQYLFERQKIARAAAQGEVYMPTIYWYPMLKFLEPVTLNGPARMTVAPSVLECIYSQMPSSIDAGNMNESSIKQEENDNDTTSNERSPSIASSSSTHDSFVDVQSYLHYDKPVAVSTPSCKRKADDPRKHNSPASTSNSVVKHRRLTTSELTDHLETFGKFVANELRGIFLSSGDVFLRRTKRQLQQVLIDAWTCIDMDESRYPGCAIDVRNNGTQS